MIRLLLFFFWGAMVYLLWQLLFAAPSKRRPRGDRVIDTMVHDPNCNTFVPKAGAIRKKIHGKEYYFCSKVCLKSYRKKLKSGIKES